VYASPTVPSRQPPRSPDAGEANAHDNVRRAGGAFSALGLSPTEFVRETRVAAAPLCYSRGELS